MDKRASPEYSRADLPPDLRAAVEAAAVLETFDGPALAALPDEPAGDALERLRAAGLVEPAGALYRLAAPVRAAALAGLEERPERLRELHGRAARHYAARLAASNAVERAALEPIYMRHLEQRCEALIQQEPTALAAEVADAPLDRLTRPEHRHLLRYYRGLGEGLLERFDAARAAFDHLLNEPDLDPAIRARVLNSGAVFAQFQGDYQRALDGYRESYALWGQVGNRARQGLALMNQGILRYLLQDYAAAEQDLLASLNVFREVGATHWQASAHVNLGLVARDLGRWEQALAYFGQAAAIWEREGPIDFLGRVANNIGEVELLRGHYEAARARFEQALAQMTTRTFAVDAWINLGLLDQARGEDAAALDRYRMALDLALELGRHEIVALVRYRIGHAEQRLGHLEAAQASYAAAIDVIEAARAPLRDEGLLISLMGRWQQVYEAAVQLCLTRGDTAGAFDYAERARARAFADLIARRGGMLARARATPLSARAAQAALPPGTLLLAYFATGLRGPESALLNAIPPQADSLRACLATPPQLLLLALSAEELRACDCPIDPNALQASSPYLADGRRFLARPVLRRAYDALIAPVADLIDQAQRVVVVPHGPLHQLPFATLLDPTGRSLLDRMLRLTYAPSATVLLQALARRQRQPTQPCLALGYDGPVQRSRARLRAAVGAMRHNTARRLRHTEAEAATVARICEGVAWRGRVGMRRRLQREAGRYRWLHLACHGEFDLDDPLRSWLEIGPGERLSAAEVLASFQLRADLVTLSACRSGVSRVLRGDEPMGLVRAFLSAGARAVLVTLWPVEDTSARLLMERFYAALLEQKDAADPAAALQIAQRDLRDLTIAELRDRLRAWGEDAGDLTEGLDASLQPYADPAFWAAYVLVGSVPSSARRDRDAGGR